MHLQVFWDRQIKCKFYKKIVVLINYNSKDGKCTCELSGEMIFISFNKYPMPQKNKFILLEEIYI